MKTPLNSSEDNRKILQIIADMVKVDVRGVPPSPDGRTAIQAMTESKINRQVLSETPALRTLQNSPGDQ